MNTLKTLENRIRGWFPADFKPVQAKESRRPNSFRFDRANTGLVLIFALSVFSTVTQLEIGNDIYLVYAWFACIAGLGFMFNILAAKDIRLNMKLMLAAWFLVLSLGGAMVNVYLFLASAVFLTRVFSLAMFVLFHVQSYLSSRQNAKH
jgi:hypothetical protein